MSEEVVEPLIIPRLTRDQLEKFVVKWCENKVISSTQVPSNLWHMVFMPLFFANLSESAINHIGMIFAYVDEDDTIGRAINGYPIFSSCRFLHKLDLEIVQPAIKKRLELLETPVDLG